MAENIERIFNLEDENDVQNASTISDVTGRAKARKTALNLFALKTQLNAQELTDANYKDLNYSGYSGLNGHYFISVLGSELGNAPFTPVAGNTYLIDMQIDNIDAKIHKIVYYIQSSGVDLASSNKHYVRMGITLTLAINAGYTEYTLSTFNYVSGIAFYQGIDYNDYINNTDNYMEMPDLNLDITELAPSSVIRVDVYTRVQGQKSTTQIQFRLMQDDQLIIEAVPVPIGTIKQSIDYSYVVPSRFPINPFTLKTEFKNIDGTVSVFGSEKASIFLATEIYQTTR